MKFSNNRGLILFSLLFIIMISSGVLAVSTNVKTINFVKLDNANSVNVVPSQSITVSVNATAYGGKENEWHSTSYQIGSDSWVCVNTPDHNGGTNLESFSITAPSNIGTYSFNTIIYSDNDI